MAKADPEELEQMAMELQADYPDVVESWYAKPLRQANKRRLRALGPYLDRDEEGTP